MKRKKRKILIFTMLLGTLMFVFYVQKTSLPIKNALKSVCVFCGDGNPLRNLFLMTEILLVQIYFSFEQNQYKLMNSILLVRYASFFRLYTKKIWGIAHFSFVNAFIFFCLYCNLNWDAWIVFITFFNLFFNVGICYETMIFSSKSAVYILIYNSLIFYVTQLNISIGWYKQCLIQNIVVGLVSLFVMGIRIIKEWRKYIGC